MEAGQFWRSVSESLDRGKCPSTHFTDLDVGFQHRTTEDITWVCIAWESLVSPKTDTDPFS
jgi:hypothetical protein